MILGDESEEAFALVKISDVLALIGLAWMLSLFYAYKRLHDVWDRVRRQSERLIAILFFVALASVGMSIHLYTHYKLRWRSLLFSGVGGGGLWGGGPELASASAAPVPGPISNLFGLTVGRLRRGNVAAAAATTTSTAEAEAARPWNMFGMFRGMAPSAVAASSSSSLPAIEITKRLLLTKVAKVTTLWFLLLFLSYRLLRRV